MSRRAGPVLMTAEAKERKLADQRVRRLSADPASWSKIGATRADFEKFWKLQSGCCAICEKQLTRPGSGKRSAQAHFDHSHETGQLRGLLCYSCNTKLGFVERFLYRIIQYLGGTLKWS